MVDLGEGPSSPPPPFILGLKKKKERKKESRKEEKNPPSLAAERIIGRVIGAKTIFKFSSWTVPSLNFYLPNSVNCTGVASIKRKFLCFKWNIFQLASFRIFSLLSALKFMIY